MCVVAKVQEPSHNKNLFKLQNVVGSPIVVYATFQLLETRKYIKFAYMTTQLNNLFKSGNFL